ncbi:MAG TPA: hypothetical protein VK934_10205, partial [Fimbriimonas sp.]|nr:hypothetical protein [Fimbriimonas sp.]
MRCTPILVVLMVASHCYSQVAPPKVDTGFGQGIVFEDRNGNGKREPGEPGITGVRVSNQRDVAQTDRAGRWRLPTNEDTTFFVVKPRGWMTAKDADNV